jgi:hypothetical protein
MQVARPPCDAPHRPLPARLGPATLGLALLIALAASCARRPAPYRFRAPLVGAVTPDRAVRPPAADAPPRVRIAVREPPPRITPAAEALAAAPPRHFELDRARPAVGSADPQAVDLASRLRAHVGQRRTDDPLAFALGLLAHRGTLGDSPIDLPSSLAARGDVDGLRALAGARGGLRDGTLPDTGDLLVFSPTEAGKLVAVVVAVDPRGTIEHVHLARGVVRRGFATPSRPAEKRDADGRVLNTFVRWSDGGLPRGAPALGGQLLVAIVDRGALLR